MSSAPRDRASTHCVISKPCMGVQDRALRTRLSRVPLTIGREAALAMGLQTKGTESDTLAGKRVGLESLSPNAGDESKAHALRVGDVSRQSAAKETFLW